MNQKHRNHSSDSLAAIGLAVLLGLAVYETCFSLPVDPAAGAADPVHFLLALPGWIFLAAVLSRPGTGAGLPAYIGARPFVRWGLALALYLIVHWIFPPAAWTSFRSIPWTQFMFAVGAAGFLGWCFRPGRAEVFDGADLALAAALFLSPRVLGEGQVILRGAWAPVFLLLAGAAAFLFLTFLAQDQRGEPLRASLVRGRDRLGGARWALAAVLLLMPFVIRYGISAYIYIVYFNIRFAILLLAFWGAAFLMTPNSGRLVSPGSLAVAALALTLVSALTGLLLGVVDYPFSMHWSEGNRMYDYSLVFGQDLYEYPGAIPDPYNTPGRYGLWGVLYLWQGLPIWAHRLWNAALLSLPSILLAWALSRKIQPAASRLVIFLWLALFFIVLAPLHPPFMLVASIVALFAFHPSPLVRGASLAAAGFYAGISRWTWALAPGAWGALADLILFYPSRKGSLVQRLLPAAGMALLGFLPGFLLNLGNFVGYSTGELATAQQPLLWHRLLPNETLGPGILLLTLLTTGPLLAVLVYNLRTRPGRLDLIQRLAVWGVLLGFLGTGLVISAKIGGGGDLHNLDMYLVSLMFSLALLSAAGSGTGSAAAVTLEPAGRPAWVQALLCLLVILPVYRFSPFHAGEGQHAWLDIPARQEWSGALERIRLETAAASGRGEVLFMDQRQLLTFGYVNRVPFVPDYEKKYMMDQALASNADYFQMYYRDLAAKRFALIVTEPLRVNLKGEQGDFSQENDLWVQWVSAPTLCFYEPVYLNRPVHVQLLVPRQDPAGCEIYLPQASP